jgi:DNA repair ATPase RecN
MKVKSISLRNFAKFTQLTVDFDPDLTYLIGKNGAGKSSIGINALIAALQGVAQQGSGGNQPLIGERFRFIGTNGTSADVDLVLFDEKHKAEIKINRHITKSAASLNIEAPADYPAELNQEWLNNLFNVFLIAPKKFLELSSKEQAEALGIDTSEFDAKLKKLKEDFTFHNRILKGFGQLEYMEKVEKVDITALQDLKRAIREKHNTLLEEKKKANNELKTAYLKEYEQWREADLSLSREKERIEWSMKQCGDCLDILKEEGYEGQEVDKFLESKSFALTTILVKREELQAPKEPEYDTEGIDLSELDEIEAQISAAYDTNARADKYLEYEKALQAKNNVVKQIDKNKDSQKAVEQEKIDYIKKFKFPFRNLSIGEEGELLMNGKPLKEQYFSTGELLKVIPILMTFKNPEFKYVFLQDFVLMDEDKQKETIDYLTKQGFQLVIEVVGKTKAEGVKSILLKEQKVVESYEEETNTAPELN